MLYRPLNNDDFVLLWHWLDDPETRRFYLPLNYNLTPYAVLKMVIEDGLHLVTDTTGHPIGLIKRVEHEDHVTISLLVDPIRRGEGIAKEMLKELSENWLKIVAEVRAFVRVDNAAMIKVCEHCGFVNTGEAPGHEVPTYRFIKTK